MAKQTRLSPAEQEVQEYLTQVSAGQAGIDPQAQTLARSKSNRVAQRYGQKLVDSRLDDNARNVVTAQRDAEQAAKQAQRDQEAAQREAAAQAKAEQARNVRAGAAAGMATETDIETGRRTIKTHADGMPEFKVGPVGPVAPVATTTTVDVQGKPAALPGAGIMLGGDGAAGTAGTVETKTTFAEPIRDDRGNIRQVQPEPKTDKATGFTYTEGKDKATGLPTKTVVGVDPEQRRANQLAEQMQQLDLRDNAVKQAQNQFLPKWKPIEDEYQAAKSEREQIGKTRFEKRGAAWMRIGSTGTETIATPEQANTWQKQRQQAEERFHRAERAWQTDVETAGNLERNAAEIATAKLKLTEEKIRMDGGLPPNDGGIAMTLAEAESGPSPATMAAQQAAEEIIPEDSPKPIVQPGAEPDEAVAEAFKGVQGIESLTLDGSEAGWSWIRRDGLAIGKVDAADGHPKIILHPADNSDLRNHAAIGELGGTPVYLADGKSRMPVPEEAAWAAKALQIGTAPAANPMQADTEGAAGANTTSFPTADGGQVDGTGSAAFERVHALREIGADPASIIQKVKAGDLSIQRGEALMQNLYGSTLKVDDPAQDATFFKYLEAADPKTKQAFNAAKSTRDLKAIDAIHDQFVNDWYSENRDMPGVTWDMQAKARKIQHARTTGERMGEMAGATGGLLTDAAGSMAGMLGKYGGMGILGIQQLWSEEADRGLDDLRESTGRANTNFARGLKRNHQKWFTPEGKKQIGNVDRAVDELVIEIQNRDALGGDTERYKEALRAKLSNVTEQAYGLHAMNLEEGWEVTKDDLDPNKDAALGSALLAYMDTGDPAMINAFKRRLLLDKGSRWSELDQQTLTEGKSRLAAAFASGVYATDAEAVIEIGSTLLTAGLGKAAVTGAKLLDATTDATKSFSRIQRMQRDFAKFGLVPDTLANPAGRLGKAWNKAAVLPKVAVPNAITEGGEEAVAGLGDPLATRQSIGEQAGVGALAGLVLAPVIALPSMAAQTSRQNYERKKGIRDFADWYNGANADTPGFEPMAPADAEAALAMLDPATHGQLVEDHKQAMIELRDATEEAGNAQAPGEAGVAGPVQTAWQQAAASRLSQTLSRAAETRHALAGYVGTVVEASQSTKGMDAPTRARTLGLTKAATGRTDLLTQSERKAIAGLQTASGAPYFVDVGGRTVFTPEGRAEVGADNPLIGALIQTDESRALIEQAAMAEAQAQSTPPEAQTETTQPVGAPAPAAVQGQTEAPAAPRGRGTPDDRRATAANVLPPPPGLTPEESQAWVDQRTTGNEIGATATEPNPAALDAAEYEALRQTDPSLPDIPTAVANAKAAGQPVSKSMERAAGSAPERAQTADPVRNRAQSVQIPGVQEAIARAEARFPALAGRFVVDETSEAAGSGGAFMLGGKVVINLADVRIDLEGYDVDSQEARLDAVLYEEIIHLAQLEAALRGGERMETVYAALWAEFTPQQQKAAAAAYQGNFEEQQAWQKGAETVRMLVQQRADGQVTELTKAFSKNMPARLIALLKSAVEFLREVVASGQVPERVQQAIDTIEAMLAEFEGKDTTTPAAEAEIPPLRIIGEAITAAKARDNRLTPERAREMEFAVEDLDAVLETMPAAERRPFIDAAIDDWLESLPVEEAPAEAPGKAPRRNPYREKAQKLIASGDFKTIAAIAEQGKLQRNPPVIGLILNRKRSAKKLTEKEMARMRSKVDDMPTQEQFRGAKFGRVAAEVLSILTVPFGQGETADTMATNIQPGWTPVELFNALSDELSQIANGTVAQQSELDPNREWTDEEIAAAEEARNADPEREAIDNEADLEAAPPEVDDDGEILFSSGVNGRPAIRTTSGQTLEAPGMVLMSSRAYHGTPHKVDRFTTAKIGTGEGAQAYGWGLYFAEDEAVARYYRDTLGKAGVELTGESDLSPAAARELKEIRQKLAIEDSDGEMPTMTMVISMLRNRQDMAVAFKQRGGDAASNNATIDGVNELVEALSARGRIVSNANIYTVTLKPDDGQYLDWDKPLSEQSEKVLNAIKALPIWEKIVADAGSDSGKYLDSNLKRIRGEAVYNLEAGADSAYRHNGLTAPTEASARMLAAGIRGIRFRDGNSRSKPFSFEVNVASGQRDRLRFATLEEAEFARASRLKAFPNSNPSKIQDGSYNYVIFDESDIEITEENGQPVQPAALFSSASIGGQGSFDFGTAPSFETKKGQMGMDFGAPVEVNQPASGEAQAPEARTGEKQITAGQLSGPRIDDEWNQFNPASGTLGIPRAEMPQVKADDRSALVQFLRARGVEYETQDVLPGSLKPTQAEYSPKKVTRARTYEGGNRSILVSADNHIVDGHHQWMALLADSPKERMQVIRLKAPIRELLPMVLEMPSVAEGMPGPKNPQQWINALRSGRYEGPSEWAKAVPDSMVAGIQDIAAEEIAGLETEIAGLSATGIKGDEFKKARADLMARIGSWQNVLRSLWGRQPDPKNQAASSQLRSDQLAGSPESPTTSRGSESQPLPSQDNESRQEQSASPQNRTGESGAQRSRDREEEGGSSRQRNEVPSRERNVTGEGGKPAASPAPAAKPGELTDFGRTLAVRKNREATMREITDDQLGTLPFSKIWPKAEVDAITDPDLAALAHAVRSEVPRKPSSGYKVAGWVAKVKQVREVMRLAQELGVDAMMQRMDTGSDTLKAFANKVRILQQIPREHWDRIGSVTHWPDAYRYDGDKSVPSPYATVMLDERRIRANSLDAIVPAILEKLDVKPAGKQMQFEVRGSDRSGYKINKKGDSLYRSLKSFDTAAEALAFVRENNAALVAEWEKVKDSDNVKEADLRTRKNRDRAGTDRRQGQDVTDDMFRRDFGFSGVAFGNWVQQGSNSKERQGMFNLAYDALMDLADILGIPPKALSLNGDLGLALGADGKGKYAAHYQPGDLFINLTKTRGAGTLAHEWFHALDHYFQRQRNATGIKYGAGDMITQQPEAYWENSRTGHRLSPSRFEEIKKFGRLDNLDDWKQIEGVRPEVAEAFTDLVKALDASPMTKRARLIDKGKSDGYWSRIIERAARSFENYVIEKMQAKGYHNDYLANVTPIEEFGRDPGRYPYLLAEEMKPVTEAFDTLFSTIRVKETDRGTALFSSPTQPDLFAAAAAPDAQANLGTVKIGTKNALGAYRALTAKREAGKTLTADEEQTLLDAETALGQKMAFDMEAVAAPAPAAEPVVKESLTTPKPAARSTQQDMMLGAETLKSGQMTLFSSPTPQQDAEYLAAVEAGDMAKAQEMVDAAARAAGYTIGPVYHGTDEPSFDVFDGDVIHFGTLQAAKEIMDKKGGVEIEYSIDDPDSDGEVWAWSDRSSDGIGPFKSKKEAAAAIAKLPTEIKPYRVFLKIENPANDVDAGGTGAWRKAKGRLTAAKGHDGIIYQNEVEDPGSTSYAVFDAAQIKLADPVTRDADGKVIPLSQRFNPGSDSILYSSPTPEASAAVEQALEKMPPIYRAVFEAVAGGMSEAQVASKFSVTPKAVTNILNAVRSRITSATTAATPAGLAPAMRDGLIDGGRPDLALSTIPEVAAIDQIRNDSDVPGTREWAEVLAQAEQRLAADYAGEYDRLLEAARDQRQLSDVETAVAKAIIARETMEGRITTAEQRTKLAMLIHGYRDIGTETARSLAIRRDPHKTPAERHAMFIAEALFTPDEATRAEMRKAKKGQVEDILKGWLSRIDAIKADLLSQGIDIEATLAEFNAREKAKREALEESPRAAKAIDETFRKLTKREKAVIQAIRSGSTWENVTKLTGMPAAEAQAIYRQFYADINAAMAASAKRYLEQSLAASAMENTMRSILDDLGVPHPDDIANDAADLQTKKQQKKEEAAAVEKVRKQREKPKPKDKPSFVATPEQEARWKELAEQWRNSPMSTWRTLWETVMNNLGPIFGTSFEKARDEFIAPWRALWQTEMDLRPQEGRMTFEEWMEQPETREKWKKQPELFAEPINETTGPGQATTAVGQGALGLEEINERTGEWADGRPLPMTGQPDLLRDQINERTGTFDLNDPASVKAVLNAFALARGSKMDALMEYWRMSILSGPQTHIVNTASNAMFIAYELLPKRAAEATINTLLGIVGQGSDKAATFAEFGPMARNLRRGIQLGARNALRSWQLESRTFEAYARAEAIQLDFTGVGTEYIPPALGGKIGKIMRSLSFRAMTAADEFFKSVFAQMETAAQAHRIAKIEEKLTGQAYEDRLAELMVPGSVAWIRAIDGAKRVTFQQDLDSNAPEMIRRLDQLAELVKKGRAMPWIGRPLTFFIPFVDTPTNIFKQAIQMSPLGAFLSIVDGMRALRRQIFAGKIGKEAAQREAEQIYNRLRFVQDLTNQTIAWGAFFALQGLVDGDDEELPVVTGTVPYKVTSRGERDNAHAVMPPMTIRVGNLQFTYSRIEPFATMLASTVDLLVSMKRHGGMEPGVISETLSRFKDQVSEKTFLQGVASLLNAIQDPDRFAERLAANIATGFIPNIIRQPLREADTVIRDQNPRADEGFLTSVAKRVGYSVVPQAAPTKVDVWGNPVPANRGVQIGGTQATDMLFRILDPTNANLGATPDPIDRWIFRYNLQTADSKDRLGIQPIPNYLDMKFPGEKDRRRVALSPAEQMEANRNAGQTARAMLGEEWEGRALELETAEMIADVVSQAQKAERARLRMKYLAEGPPVE